MKLSYKFSQTKNHYNEELRDFLNIKVLLHSFKSPLKTDHFHLNNQNFKLTENRESSELKYNNTASSMHKIYDKSFGILGKLSKNQYYLTRTIKWKAKSLFIYYYTY